MHFHSYRKTPHFDMTNSYCLHYTVESNKVHFFENFLIKALVKNLAPIVKSGSTTSLALFSVKPLLSNDDLVLNACYNERIM